MPCISASSAVTPATTRQINVTFPRRIVSLDQRPSQVEHRRPVVAERLLHARLLPVLLGDGDEDHAHHQNHQPDGHQGRPQDVGDPPAVAGKIQAADDEAARQEAAAGGHEVDGEPEHFTLAA